jgi:hypothetical protein
MLVSARPLKRHPYARTVLACLCLLAGPGALDVMSSGPAAHAAPALATPTPPAGLSGRRFASRDVVSGRLVRETAASIVIQGFAGNETLARSAAMRFFVATPATLSVVTVGARVTIRLATAQTSRPVISVAPAGSLFGVVQPFRAGFRAPTGTPTRTFTRPPAGRLPSLIAGIVTGTHGSAVTVRTVQGKTQTVTLHLPLVYRFAPAAEHVIATGTLVGATTTAFGSQRVAVDLVTASAPNVSAFLTTAP